MTTFKFKYIFIIIFGTDHPRLHFTKPSPYISIALRSADIIVTSNMPFSLYPG